MNWYKKNNLYKTSWDWKKSILVSLGAPILAIAFAVGLTLDDIKQLFIENNGNTDKVIEKIEEIKQTKEIKGTNQTNQTSIKKDINTKQDHFKDEIDHTKIAWGSKVSKEFKKKVIDISNKLGANPDFIMACMAFETGGKFSASTKNMAGSSGTGLIQFMEPTAKSMGTNTKELSTMTAEKQLDYVYKYLSPYTGRLNSIEDTYMAILYPKAIGKGKDFILFKSQSNNNIELAKSVIAGRSKVMPKEKAYSILRSHKEYTQNSGLDSSRKGYVTVEDAAKKVKSYLIQGLSLAG
jgi:hypothetical protein